MIPTRRAGRRGAPPGAPGAAPPRGGSPAAIEVRALTERTAWNALVLSLGAADLRQSWEWGEILGRQGWRPLRLAAFAGGTCRAAMAVLVRALPGLGRVAFVPRGPLLGTADDGVPALAALVAAAGAATGAAFLRVSPALADGVPALATLAAAGLRPLDDFWSLWNPPRNVMRLDLAGSEREVLGRMAPKRRQHVATAAKKGLAATVTTDRAALRTFYAMLREHAARQRYPIRSWSYFEALWEAFGAPGAAALVLGHVGGTPAAALLGVRFGPVAYSLYAPSTPAARATALGDLVHWEWIRWARAQGCREIDFGSSGTHVPPRPTDRALGIYRFKAELGCHLVLYAPYHDAVFAPGRYRLLRALERAALGRARGWLARLPAPLRGALARRLA